MQTTITQLYAIVEESTCSHDGLLSGRLGLVLYFCSLYKMGNGVGKEKARQLFFEILDDINNEKGTLQTYTYSAGLAGFAFTACLLKEEGILIEDIEDLLEDIEVLLFQCATEEMAIGKNDFLHQAAGAIHYFTYRLEQPKSREYARQLIQQFIKTGISDDLGFRHFNIFSRPKKRLVDTGMAHGMSGWILILCNLYEKGIMRIELEPVIRESMKYILECKKWSGEVADASSIYPIFTDENNANPEFSRRMAWCYGDLNLLLLFHRVYQLFEEDCWLKEAEEIANHILPKKEPREVGVADAHFCHGACGVAQMYLTIYRISKKEDYKAAYDHWMEVTRKLLKKDITKETFKGVESSLIDGLAGIDLVLKSSISQKPMPWEKIFLLG